MAPTPSPRRETARSRTLIRAVLLAAGILVAILLFRAVGWPAIAANLERVGPGRFFFLVAIYVFTQCASAVGWWLVIEPLPAPSRLPALFAVYLAGDSVNYL